MDNTNYHKLCDVDNTDRFIHAIACRNEDNTNMVQNNVM